MDQFVYPVQVRWADIDANFHLRHSVYYDWGASCRLTFLYQHGLTSELMQQLHFGPVIFREECIFRREIRLGDPVFLSLEIISAKKDYSRWSIQHTIMKNPDSVSAILTVDGAWLDTAKRKLAVPPAEAVKVFSEMPLSSSFTWLD
jgi:acyl-CoA thioester hydrolase